VPGPINGAQQPAVLDRPTASVARHSPCRRRRRLSTRRRDRGRGRRSGLGVAKRRYQRTVHPDNLASHVTNLPHKLLIDNTTRDTSLSIRILLKNSYLLTYLSYSYYSLAPA